MRVCSTYLKVMPLNDYTHTAPLYAYATQQPIQAGSRQCSRILGKLRPFTLIFVRKCDAHNLLDLNYLWTFVNSYKCRRVHSY